MAMKMPKVDPFKAGALALLLADLAAAYPVYTLYITDPKSEIAPFSAGAAPIKLNVGKESDTEEMRTGQPPKDLLQWDPFKIPVRGLGSAGGGEEEETQAAVPTNQPIATDNIRLYGIIQLNGEYRALVSVSGGTAPPPQGGPGQPGQVPFTPLAPSGGAPPEEVRQGMILPGTTDIKAAQIRRDGILLTQPGSQPTFLPLTIPGLSEPKPWFRGGESGALRGRIQINR